MTSGHLASLVERRIEGIIHMLVRDGSILLDVVLQSIHPVRLAAVMVQRPAVVRQTLSGRVHGGQVQFQMSLMRV